MLWPQAAPMKPVKPLCSRMPQLRTPIAISRYIAVAISVVSKARFTASLATMVAGSDMPAIFSAAATASLAIAAIDRRSSGVAASRFAPRSPMTYTRSAPCGICAPRSITRVCAQIAGAQLCSRKERRIAGEIKNDIALRGRTIGASSNHKSIARRGRGDVVPKDVLELDRRGGRRDRVGVEPGEDRVLVEDVVQLALEPVELVGRHAAAVIDDLQPVDAAAAQTDLDAARAAGGSWWMCARRSRRREPKGERRGYK